VKRLTLVAALATAAAIGSTTALAAAPGAHGKICGASRCATLSIGLAKAISQRNGSFSPASAPKPAPYYKITIKAHGEGFIRHTIIWVPSRKLWFDKQYVTPPLAGYWRTDRASLRPKLEAAVKSVKPHAAPAKWSTVLPK
jgi:hypothetical protein